jgi:hypothetical protein
MAPRDRSQEIHQLFQEFDSDDEAQAVAAVTANQKGSSSSTGTGTGTRIKPTAAADKAREEEVAARITFLRRIKGGFPVFDDDKPDPGCSCEVEKLTEAFDPSSELIRRAEEQLQVSKDGVSAAELRKRMQTMHYTCARFCSVMHLHVVGTLVPPCQEAAMLCNWYD